MQLTQTARNHCQHPDGCERPVKAYGWCRPHHDRIKKSGTPGPAAVKRYKPLGRRCVMSDCTTPVTAAGARGMCAKHYLRFRRHGDPTVVGTGGTSMPLDKNPNWSGSQASYSAVHQRLARYRGPASGYLCADCGVPADHWSFNGRISASWRSDGALDYSTDLGDYDPRCVPCHSAYDRNRVTGDRP